MKHPGNATASCVKRTPATLSGPDPTPPRGGTPLDPRDPGLGRPRHRRHRLAPRRHRSRPADDAGPRPVLRRHGPHQERPQHADDELRVHRAGHGRLAGRLLLAGVRRRHVRGPDRRTRTCRHGRDRPRRSHRQRSHPALHHVPAHVRDPHRRPDQRGDRGPYEVRGVAGLRAGVDPPRIRSRRPLGMGAGRVDRGRPRRPRLRRMGSSWRSRAERRAWPSPS